MKPNAYNILSVFSVSGEDFFELMVVKWTRLEIANRRIEKTSLSRQEGR